MADAHRAEIAKLENLYAEHPEGRIFTHLAEAYRKAGELDRAHEVLVEGIRRHPEYSSAHVVLGRVLVDQGRMGEADTEFRRVLDLDAQNLVALRALGDSARAEGRHDEALDYYGRLLDVEPSNEEVRAYVDSQGAGVGESPGATGPAPDEAAPDEGVPVSEDLDRTGVEPGVAEPAGGGWISPEPDEAGEPAEWSGGDAESTGPFEAWAPSEAAESGPVASPDEEFAEEGTAGSGSETDESEAESTPFSGAGEPAFDSWAEVAEPDEPDWRTAEAADPDSAPAIEPGVTTETIARVYARQGLYDRAADVYRELLRDRPGDDDLRTRLEEMEALAAEPTEDRAEHVGLEDHAELTTSLDTGEGVGGGAYSTGEDEWATQEPASDLETLGSVEAPHDAEAEPAEPAAVAELEGFEAGELETGGTEGERLPGLEAEEIDPDSGLVAETVDAAGTAETVDADAIDLDAGFAEDQASEVDRVEGFEPGDGELDTPGPEPFSADAEAPVGADEIPAGEAERDVDDSEPSAEAPTSQIADEPWLEAPVSGEAPPAEAPAEPASVWSGEEGGLPHEAQGSEARDEPWLEAPVTGEASPAEPLTTEEPTGELAEEPTGEPTAEGLEEPELADTSVWTGAEWTPEASETPYAWAEEETVDEADASPPIGAYFRDLLAWSEGSGTASSGRSGSGGSGSDAARPASDASEAGSGETVGSSGQGGDDDLEMFRAWLESLKK